MNLLNIIVMIIISKFCNKKNVGIEFNYVVSIFKVLFFSINKFLISELIKFYTQNIFFKWNEKTIN